ncbi:coiled-coil domain-containing protein 149-like isoform X2 [Lineus longissimus]|uniref:coiled-coil domain-containing protein 149-like isoform X2 n=1 Tax=Lineus longissimus TaxID=88925 RepID=UPI00315DD8E5
MVDEKNVKMSVAGSFQRDYDVLRGELQIYKRKLDSKAEALLILSKELDQCRSERDQFKLMAEQLRERYQALKRQVTGKSPQGANVEYVEAVLVTGNETENVCKRKQQPPLKENLSLRLYQVKEANKCLQFEADDLKQKLHDADGDIKLLREQIARQRVGTTDEGMNTRHFPAHEREELVKELEASREQYVQLERDLQTVLDEKEEQETERDAFKHKYERLNKELNYILKGDEKRILDIDALSTENRYLQERLKQMEEEKSIAMATVSKYKSILEKKKKGTLKIGQNRSGGVVISQKQVHQLLESTTGVAATQQTVADLQGLSRALLESLNDKNLALSHQRKTNKILGNRVSELEKKLKTLEVAGLWNVPARASSLEKLKMECDDIRTLIPHQTSLDRDKNDANHSSDLESELGQTPQMSPEGTPNHVLKMSGGSNAGLLLEDLDLLPTKEQPQQADQGCKSGEILLSPLQSPGSAQDILAMFGQQLNQEINARTVTDERNDYNSEDAANYVEEFSRKEGDFRNSADSGRIDRYGNSVHVMPQEEESEESDQAGDEEEDLHNIDLDNKETNDDFYEDDAQDNEHELQSELQSLLENASSLITMPKDPSIELEDLNMTAKVGRKTVTFADDTVPGDESPRCTSPLLNLEQSQEDKYELPEML